MALKLINHPPSTNVIAVSWDSEDLSLYIEFKQNKVYKYLHVPENVALGFEQALDSNEYFTANVKFMYEYERIS